MIIDDMNVRKSVRLKYPTDLPRHPNTETLKRSISLSRTNLTQQCIHSAVSLPVTLVPTELPPTSTTVRTSPTTKGQRQRVSESGSTSIPEPPSATNPQETCGSGTTSEPSKESDFNQKDWCLRKYYIPPPEIKWEGKGKAPAAAKPPPNPSHISPSTLPRLGPQSNLPLPQH
ncbi:hypothetical protein BGX38DRAFT_923383 [Terfezia claveryi]|nr:hypothetical protein BGX38DRAFT_923383 [Terfezia claveryi]